VLLVEGATEKALINSLFELGKLEMPKGGVFVLDCFGKFNMHRFMNLLGPLGIDHSVLYDSGMGAERDKKLAALIGDSKNDCTKSIAEVPGDVEAALGVPKATDKYKKAQHVMIFLREGKIPAANLDKFAQIVGGVLQ
jgi:predicted ATP-dependent endonuclease of OLD family